MGKPRQWAALLVSNDNGILAPVGHEFTGAPEGYEKVVVQEASPEQPQYGAYRVVDVDNFDGEGPGSTERFITEPVGKEIAETVAKAMNERFGGDHAPRFYRVVPHDYKLFIFEP